MNSISNPSYNPYSTANLYNLNPNSNVSSPLNSGQMPAMAQAPYNPAGQIGQQYTTAMVGPNVQAQQQREMQMRMQQQTLQTLQQGQPLQQGPQAQMTPPTGEVDAVQETQNTLLSMNNEANALIAAANLETQKMQGQSAQTQGTPTTTTQTIATAPTAGSVPTTATAPAAAEGSMSPDGKNIFLLGQWMPVDQARQVFSNLSQQAARSPGESVNIGGVMIPKAVIASTSAKLESVLALKTKLDNKEITQEQYDTATGKQKTEDLQREGQAFLTQLQNPQATQQVAMASPPRSASPPESAVVNLPQTINAPMNTATATTAPTTTTGVTTNMVPSNMTTVSAPAPMATATPGIPPNANVVVLQIPPNNGNSNGQNVVINLPQASATASGQKTRDKIDNMMEYFSSNIKPPDLYGGEGNKNTA
ncbi:MAG: hypothetical protein HEQ32_09420 [Vampirovibrio sp.]